ncbi:hypothetical protein [Streptomyces sp. NPDC090798]|uniref:hypothetical protein n=1 Tax=Streptomyces sp. NPDC090798 TaxID=3365968 RepID=UPI003808DB3F
MDVRTSADGHPVWKLRALGRGCAWCVDWARVALTALRSAGRASIWHPSQGAVVALSVLKAGASTSTPPTVASVVFTARQASFATAFPVAVLSTYFPSITS